MPRGCQNHVHAGGATAGLRIGPDARFPGLVRRQRARRRVVVVVDPGGEMRFRERIRRAARRIRPAWNQRHRPGARAVGPLPRRGEPGGIPRPVRGVRVARRERGATARPLGLLPRSSVDRARLRGCGRRALCDRDDRVALRPGGALPGVGARRASRRERGRGDLRLEAGVRDAGALQARAAAELGSFALGVDPCGLSDAAA